MRSANAEGVTYDQYKRYTEDTASLHAYQDENPLLSAEAIPENNGLIDFATFTREFPEKLFPLLAKLRPEFQEFFIEFYILHKPQSFIGQTHGCIQTRVWQSLRVAEQTIGALILLGTDPTVETIHKVLAATEFETQDYGRLSDMIALYAKTQSYAEVAQKFAMPTPAVRKIFRPAIKALLADKRIKVVAVGAYLRGLTHQSSLTDTGASKQTVARLRRVKIRVFKAPPIKASPLVSVGAVTSLKNQPWHMMEIATEHRMNQILPLLEEQAKKSFRKKPGQVFAPLDADGNLLYGYIFARSKSIAAIRSIVHTRGLAGVAAQYDGDGKFTQLITVPDEDVQKIIEKVVVPSKVQPVRKNDYVEILSGPASNYCGTVTEVDHDKILVEVKFPTGRTFRVRATFESVRKITELHGQEQCRLFYQCSAKP